MMTGQVHANFLRNIFWRYRKIFLEGVRSVMPCGHFRKILTWVAPLRFKKAASSHAKFCACAPAFCANISRCESTGFVAKMLEEEESTATSFSSLDSKIYIYYK